MFGVCAQHTPHLFAAPGGLCPHRDPRGVADVHACNHLHAREAVAAPLTAPVRTGRFIYMLDRKIYSGFHHPMHGCACIYVCTSVHCVFCCQTKAPCPLGGAAALMLSPAHTPMCCVCVVVAMRAFTLCSYTPGEMAACQHGFSTLLRPAAVWCVWQWQLIARNRPNALADVLCLAHIFGKQQD